jgi:hypothetical protein
MFKGHPSDYGTALIEGGLFHISVREHQPLCGRHIRIEGWYPLTVRDVDNQQLPLPGMIRELCAACEVKITSIREMQAAAETFEITASGGAWEHIIGGHTMEPGYSVSICGVLVQNKRTQHVHVTEMPRICPRCRGIMLEAK